MNSIIAQKQALSSNQLHEKLTLLNRSLKGIIPIINTRNVDDILHLPLQETTLAWNWSKGFNH